MFRTEHNLSEVPVVLLNNWVTKNQLTNNIPNKKWNVSSGVNNGFPIFSEEIAGTELFGSGTNTDPYRISTIANLKWMRDKVNNDNANYSTRSYKLMADLDFAGTEDWIPIGATWENPFKGTFDGNGKVIRNINIGTIASPSKNELAGLFGCIGGGSVSNLGIGWKCIYTTGSVMHAGGIVGYNSGSVTHCFVFGQILTSCTGDASVGGIVGGNSGIINDCNSIGTFEGLSLTFGTIYSGGIAGNNYGTISNSYHKGKITASSTSQLVYSGGITGDNKNIIFNCYAITHVFGNSGSSNCYSGGIAGRNERILSNCYAAGTVNATVNATEPSCAAGGITGWNYTKGILTYCLALNDTITSISRSSHLYDLINRIAYYTNGGTLQKNYAKSTMIMRMGSTISNLVNVSNKNGLNHGINIAEQPVAAEQLG